VRAGGHAAGFTYLGVLFLLAFMAIAATAVSAVWQVRIQREREAELLFAGVEFRRAIGAYYEASPGKAKTYPRALADLVRDPRYPDVRRHLRRIYVDPMTGSEEWGLLKAADGGIAGVFSRSEKPPLKRAGFPVGARSFESAKRYSDWIFAYGAAAQAKSGAAQGSAAGAPPSPVAAGGAQPADAGGAITPSAARAVPPASAQKASCAAFAADDEATCAAAAQKWGEEFGWVCLAHLPARVAACMQQRPVPPLPVKP
jgi:type II secretory pathway pseudopilin PulG